uniref:C2 domain-containing protein n=1 Tax=Periophthalmus magnuspinnatus TaxID=409849 RepID=A0A3B3ZMB9_9GOBI
MVCISLKKYFILKNSTKVTLKYSAGFNPTWNEKFQFDIYVPELAMVRFVVEDYDAASQNDLVGHYCLPLSSAQNGYRHVPLLTKRGDVICSAGLFVHLMLIDTQKA